VADGDQHRGGRALDQPGLPERGARAQALALQDADQDHHPGLTALRLHRLPALARAGLARDRGLGNADRHAGRRRLPVAGVQQSRLLAHPVVRHHDWHHRLHPRSRHGLRRGPSPDGLMAFREIHGLRKAFVTPRGTTEVLGGVDLALEEGEFVAVVGYSGSGKTTLVNLVAGLLTADAGDIVLDGERVSEPGPERGIVFQQYSLLPWMTVHENVALAVDAVNPGVPARERRRITDELVGLVNLTPAAWKRRAAAATPAAPHEPDARVPEGAAGARRIPEIICSEAARPGRAAGGLREVLVVPSFVEIAQLGKTYETPTGPAIIVRDFTLDIREGEFVCIVGHSGCGKSTVLSIVMGLTLPTRGGVVIAGREVDGPGTDRRLVFPAA